MKLGCVSQNASAGFCEISLPQSAALGKIELVLDIRRGYQEYRSLIIARLDIRYPVLDICRYIREISRVLAKSPKPVDPAQVILPERAVVVCGTQAGAAVCYKHHRPVLV